MEKQQDLPLEATVEAQELPAAEMHCGWWRARQFGLAMAAIGFVADVVTKLAVLGSLNSLPVAVIPGFFTLTFAWNRGVSFSFLADAEHPLHLFGLVIPAEAWLPALWGTVALVAIAMFLWWLGQEPRRLAQAGIGFIIGGAAGNLVDRIVHGAVVDFLLVYHHPWYFPAFNVADMSITCGVGLLFLDALRQNREQKNKGNDKSNDA